MADGASDESRNPLPSVRVEVDSGSAGAPTPEVSSSSDGPSSTMAPLAIAAIVAALVLVGLGLFSLAPEAGEAADGTPITQPTTTTILDSTSTTSPNTVTSNTTTSNSETQALLQPTDAAELGDAVFPLEAFDSAEPPGFLFDVVSFDVPGEGTEWFGVAFGELGFPELTRSTDGLTWETLEVAGSSHALGLAKVDDRLVVAIDTESPSVADELFDPERPYNIEFFGSADGREWESSLDFAPMVGEGSVFFVAIGSEAAALPVRRIVDEANVEGLVSYFDGVLNPDRARSVCDAEHSNIGGTRVAILSDCDGNIIGELNEYDAPDLFRQPGYIQECIGMFLTEEAYLREVLLIQQRRPAEVSSTAPIISEVPYSVNGFGRMFGSAYLSSGFRIGLEEQCNSDGPSSSVPWTLARTTAEEGTVEVAEQFSVTTGGVAELSRTDSGEAMLLVNSLETGVAVLRASPPYDDWTSTLLANAAELRTALWSMTADGSLMFGATSDRWIFVTPDGEIVHDLAIVEGGLAQIIVATGDFAIVQLDFERQRLIRVPLTDSG